MSITKIVITGGPCGGKSTALSRIQREFVQLGYQVLFVSETATELITGGVAPWTCSHNLDFQKCQTILQVRKEEVYEMAARSMQKEKILIVCDRGVLDNKAYMNEEEFQEVLSCIGKSEVILRDSYDAVFHLVTAAKGAETYYTTSNNTARTETVEQAAALDDKLIAAWTGHPHLRVIDNSTDFETKMKKLLSEIAHFLGEPEHLEIERKFLIEYPDMAWLEQNPQCQRVEIIQTYLRSDNGDEVRVRQRGIGDNYIYFKTIKRRITDIKRVEIEERLSQSEYIKLLMEADTSKRQIRKTRYCLMYSGQYFEIDVYPFWKDQAIVEIEVSSEDHEKIVFPPELKVIREVSGDITYSNRYLAQM